jgi:hypothetical protein
MTALDPVGLEPADAAADAAVDSLARARRQVAWTSTAERVADAVREEVVEGRLRPGARLPEQRLVHGARGLAQHGARGDEPASWPSGY